MLRDILAILYAETLELRHEQIGGTDSEYDYWPDYHAVKTPFTDLVTPLMENIKNRKRKLLWDETEQVWLSLDQVIFETPFSKSSLGDSLRYSSCFEFLFFF
jgi:hypothetical protein